MKTISYCGGLVLLSLMLVVGYFAQSGRNDLVYVEPMNVPGIPIEVGAATVRKNPESVAMAWTLEFTLYNLSNEDVKNVTVNLYQVDENNKVLGTVFWDISGVMERGQSKTLTESFASLPLCTSGKACGTNVKAVDPLAVRFIVTVQSACVYKGRLVVSMADLDSAVRSYLGNGPFCLPDVKIRKGQKGWACPF